MKRLKLKQGVKDFLGIALLYLVIIVGVELLDLRTAEINAQKNTSQQIVEARKEIKS